MAGDRVGTLGLLGKGLRKMEKDRHQAWQGRETQSLRGAGN